MLYGVKGWLVKNSYLKRMKMAQIRMIRWMCGHTRRHTIMNEDIRDKVVETCVGDKMQDARLRWFEYVKRGAQRPSEEVREVGSDRLKDR